MKRRSLLKTGGCGVVVSTAGCVGPINDIIQNDNDEDNNDNNGTNNYYDLMPTSSLNDKDGLFSVHVKINELRDQFPDSIKNAYKEYDISSYPITLLSGSGLLSVEPIVDSEFDGHKMEDQIRSITGVSAEELDVDIQEYIMVDDHLLVLGDLGSEYLTETVGYSDQGDGVFGSEDSVLLTDGWLVIPFDGDTTNYQESSSDDQRIDDVYSDLLGSDKIGSGTINVLDIQTDVDVGEVSFDPISIASSATFEDGIETHTRITTESDLDDNINDEFNGTVSYDEESGVLSIDTEWAQ